MTTELQRLLEYIQRHPFDADVRLAFADACEEAGEINRAIHQRKIYNALVGVENDDDPWYACRVINAVVGRIRHTLNDEVENIAVFDKAAASLGLTLVDFFFLSSDSVITGNQMLTTRSGNFTFSEMIRSVFTHLPATRWESLRTRVGVNTGYRVELPSWEELSRARN